MVLLLFCSFIQNKIYMCKPVYLFKFKHTNIQIGIVKFVQRQQKIVALQFCKATFNVREVLFYFLRFFSTVAKRFCVSNAMGVAMKSDE